MTVMYRYDLFGDTIALSMYRIARHTPKGVWVSSYHMADKWVSNTSKKRYCYPTKQEAWESFFRRQERRLQILNVQREAVKDALAYIADHKEHPANEYTPVCPGGFETANILNSRWAE